MYPCTAQDHLVYMILLVAGKSQGSSLAFSDTCMRANCLRSLETTVRVGFRLRCLAYVSCSCFHLHVYLINIGPFDF